MSQLEFRWSGKKISVPVSQAIAAICIALVVGVGVGSQLPGIAFATPIHDPRAPNDVDLAPLFKAWSLLDQNFVPISTSTKDKTAQEKLYGAIQGLAASYGDDYTVFFPPVQKSIFDTTIKGDFGGVGMEIGLKNGILTVIAPIKDTPASRAGILTDDRIVAIDGVTTNGMAVDAAVNKIRGEKGTSVKVTISRETKDQGKPFDVTLVRDTIILPTIDTKLRDDGVFVIALYSFDSNSPRKFSDALREFENSGSDKLIIDLRGNPGGYLEAAVDIASWFLPQGDVVVTEHYGAKQADDVFRSSGFGSRTQNAKIAVLINGGSASAAEILAGALHDHGKATLVGTKSFGKGSVQQLFDVTADTSLKITIARWLTPNGTSISHKGIDPDIVVELTEADLKAKHDTQTDRAAQYLLTGK